MGDLRVIADDLTGACDVAVELLPWPGGVAVAPDGDGDVGDWRGLVVRSTQSRTLAAKAATDAVRRALGADGRPCDVILKKIDTGLRGGLGTEIDAAMEAGGVAEAFVLAAIPDVGRTTVGGIQHADGVPVHETAFANDPQNPVCDACIARVVMTTSRHRATHVALADVRSGSCEAAIARACTAGHRVVVCDAETDADIERTLAVILRRPKPVLLVGSTGLARAYRRLDDRRPNAEATDVQHAGPLAAGGTLIVVGSAHPTAHRQVAHAVESANVVACEVASDHGAPAVDRAAGQLLADGHHVALMAPRTVVPGTSARVLGSLAEATERVLAGGRVRSLVLIGGETAHAVLARLGHPLLGIAERMAPLTVRGWIVRGEYAGLPVVTKGGSTGPDDRIAAIVRRMSHVTT